MMRARVVANFDDLRVAVRGGEVALLHVGGEDGRFVGEQEEAARR